MASERRCAANRANAKKSTGPKSRAGKMRSSRNAYRHGLSAAPPCDTTWTARVDRLARKIVNSAGQAIELAEARIIAEAQLEIERALAPITVISAQIFAHLGNDRQPALSALRPSGMTVSPPPEKKTLDSVGHLLKLWKKLDRYLHRALVRRDRAVRRFIWNDPVEVAGPLMQCGSGGAAPR
jgi:hypothetical protein